MSAPRVELNNLLTELGCSVRALPKAAQEAFAAADGFTLVTGVGPKGYGNRIPIQHLVANLEEYPQMVRTLEFCKVFVVVNGELFDKGRPLDLPDIEPMDGAEQPRIISIPKALKDPASGEQIPTTNGGSLPSGTLVLRTSRVSMRFSKKGRHSVVYKAQSGYIGYVPVPELDVESPYRDRIYGQCDLEALEPYKQNDRGRLANSPLARAVEGFVSAQIQAYAREFEARERRKYAQEEKNAISKMNEALDRWKNRFLNEYMRGLWGEGPGLVEPPPPLPAGKPARLELALTHDLAGVGISFRPVLKFFDETGRRIRPVPFKWVSEDTNVAMVDEDLMVINTFAPGRTLIYAETLDGLVMSNKAPLQVLRIREIRIAPSELEIGVGSRQRLEAVCRLIGGEETTGVYLEWTESNPTIAKVSSAGLVFGFAPGDTEVTCGDDTCLAKEPARVKVVASEGRGRGDRRGRGYPLVLVSGEIDFDPETKEYVHFSSEDPPVAQRPQDSDRGIWWINSAAPLAKLYLDKNNGYGYESPQWRMYHLERYVDAIVQIALTRGPTEKESLSAEDWILRWGIKAAEIQLAATADLTHFLASGELPEG